MKDKRSKIGLPPGSVIFTGNRKVDKISIHYLQYDALQFSEKVLNNQGKFILHQSNPEVVDWYDIRGLHDTDLIQVMGQTFNIHSLIQEDIVDPNQRPKYEEYESGIFIIIHALSYRASSQDIVKEQVALFFREGLVLTFQETASDLFTAVRSRIHKGLGRIRSRGADYLVFALLDTIVDQYYNVIGEVEEEIQSLEDQIIRSEHSNAREQIHHLRSSLRLAHKNIGPFREAIQKFVRTENELVAASSTVFLKDLYDQTVQLIEMLESHLDTLNGLQDLHLSEISFRMNQVMKVLTVITTIFVPLSFLAGLYGMNFDHIPELRHKYGYFILLFCMFLIASSLLLWFNRKKWL